MARVCVVQSKQREAFGILTPPGVAHIKGDQVLSRTHNNCQCVQHNPVDLRVKGAWSQNNQLWP